MPPLLLDVRAVAVTRVHYAACASHRSVHHTGSQAAPGIGVQLRRGRVLRVGAAGLSWEGMGDLCSEDSGGEERAWKQDAVPGAVPR